MNPLEFEGLVTKSKTDMNGDVRSWAVFSPHGDHRYALGRYWADAPVVVWMMHNPSVADHAQPDPTITKIVKISRFHGFGALVVVNLFTVVGADKKILLDSHEPIGPRNFEVIEEVLHHTDCIIGAWGKVDKRLAWKAQSVLACLGKRVLWCISQNNDGSPIHPLYQRDNAGIQTFDRIEVPS